MSDESLDNLFGLLEKDIRLPVFIYEEAYYKYKREHNLKYEMEYFKNLLQGGSDALKYERIEFIGIGSKYIHLKIFDKYLQDMCMFSTKKLIKIPRCYLYNHKLNFEYNIKLLEKGKTYKIVRIEKQEVDVLTVDKNAYDYYAVIKLKDEPVNYPQSIIDNCCACMEEKQMANEEGYFKCSHKDCICNNCYTSLHQKICPICRSN